MQRLHLGQQVTEMLAVAALLAVPVELRLRRTGERSRCKRLVDPRSEGAFERRGQHADAGFGRRTVDVVVIEQLAGEGPQPRSDIATRAWLSAVPSPSRSSQPLL